MAVEIEPEIGLTVAFAVPAIFLDGKFGLKISGRIKIKAFSQGRIEKGFVVFEMVEVGHGQHAGSGAGEYADEQLMNVGELHFQLIQQRPIILAQGGVGGEGSGNIVQGARHIKDHALPPEFAFDHRLPVAGEPFVA